MNFRSILIFLLSAGFLASCNQSPKTSTSEQKPVSSKEKVVVPRFNADSAFVYVKAQTDFGPRVPGSDAHAACATYLQNKLLQYTEHVSIQEFKARTFDGKVLEGKNVIASFKPESKARIMLSAHWDSRPFADHDQDETKHKTPIDGANDGASGTGILIEVARQLSMELPRVGVDIVLFDLEDYGPPDDAQNDGSNEAWGLGSQYWARNPHTTNYRARFVILLDMVGASDATFLQEGFSMYFAPDKVKKVWDIAHELGYQDYFINQLGGYINDDHYYINEIRNIPAIDIIHLDPASANGSFFDHWHTLDDNIDKIDKKTLDVVGDVVIHVLFREK
jgi:Zn-dependent M28 family amino/carboxypeptidase